MWIITENSYCFINLIINIALTLPGKDCEVENIRKSLKVIFEQNINIMDRW